MSTTTDTSTAVRHWVFIERDQGAKHVMVGPYPDAAAAGVACDESPQVDWLLSPKGGGGTDCYTVEFAAGQEPADAEQQAVWEDEPDDTWHTESPSAQEQHDRAFAQHVRLHS